jgi:hypothetical protein
VEWESVRQAKGLWPWSRRSGRRAAASSGDSSTDGGAIAPAKPAGLDFRIGWKQADPTMATDVKTFWSRLNLLPPEADPDERAREIVVAGYAGATVVAVSTAVIQEIPFLRSRMAIFRAAVGPAFARSEVFVQLGVQTRAVLEGWSRDNPDEGVMGLVTVFSGEASRSKTAPHRAETGLSLAAFTENDEKVMVAWFDHALV